MGPSDPRSTVLTPLEEAMILEFRRRTLLPLDDVLGCLRDTIPRLTRSALHRCLKRHGISRLPETESSSTSTPTPTTGPAFLRSVVAAFPYQIRIVLTDNGTPFADLPKTALIQAEIKRQGAVEFASRTPILLKSRRTQTQYNGDQVQYGGLRAIGAILELSSIVGIIPIPAGGGSLLRKGDRRREQDDKSKNKHASAAFPVFVRNARLD